VADLDIDTHLNGGSVTHTDSMDVPAYSALLTRACVLGTPSSSLVLDSSYLPT
jgi:hypothetical protein